MEILEQRREMEEDKVAHVYRALQSCCCSVAKSYWTLCNPRTVEARLPHPPLSSGVCSDSCPLSWWCYLTISSSVIPFSFAFNLCQHQGLFPWVSSLHQVAKVFELPLQHKVLPMNIQGWFLLGLTDWISLLSTGLPRVFSSTIIPKHPFFGTQPSLWSNAHIHIQLLQLTTW